jgi:hypothetical protein
VHDSVDTDGATPEAGRVPAAGPTG